jgi:hypothetical protein
MCIIATEMHMLLGARRQNILQRIEIGVQKSMMYRLEENSSRWTLVSEFFQYKDQIITATPRPSGYSPCNLFVQELHLRIGFFKTIKHSSWTQGRRRAGHYGVPRS